MLELSGDVSWCCHLVSSQSWPGTSLVQSGPLSTHYHGWADLDTGNGNLDLLNWAEPNHQSSGLLLDKVRRTEQTVLFRRGIAAWTCAPVQPKPELEHRSRLQNRSNYSSSSGETVANQLNDKTRNKNSKSASHLTWHSPLSLLAHWLSSNESVLYWAPLRHYATTPPCVRLSASSID